MSHLLFQSVPFLLKGASLTIILSACAISLGLLGGSLLGIFNSERLKTKVTGGLISSFVWAIRGTPVFVQILLAYYALPELLGLSLSPISAGLLALGINSMAYISEIVRGGMDAIPEGQWEAAHALGLSKGQTVREIILPQMVRKNVPTFINEFSALIKETSALMIIGVAELTKVSKDIVSRELDPMGIYLTAALLYLIMTSSVAFCAHMLKQRGIL